MDLVVLWTALGVLLVALMAIIRGVIADSRVKATLEVQMSSIINSADSDRKRFIAEISEVRKATESNTQGLSKLTESQDWVKKFAERQEGEIKNINQAVGDLNKAIIQLEATLTSLNNNIIAQGSSVRRRKSNN